MEIITSNLGKKYNREWIFRKMDLHIASGSRVAITGYNGSGKSTLIKLLSGYTLPSEGKVTYGNGASHTQDIQTSFTFCAPYQHLIEEFSLVELLHFHQKFKRNLISIEDMLDHSGLTKAKNKQIREFSSGMKQRLRLILAFFFHSEVIFLDEPASNLDAQGTEWYMQLIRYYAGDRTVLIASNQPEEYSFCEMTIPIETWK